MHTEQACYTQTDKMSLMGSEPPSDDNSSLTYYTTTTTTTTTILRSLDCVRDYPGEPVPER